MIDRGREEKEELEGINNVKSTDVIGCHSDAGHNTLLELVTSRSLLSTVVGAAVSNQLRLFRIGFGGMVSHNLDSWKLLGAMILRRPFDSQIGKPN